MGTPRTEQTEPPGPEKWIPVLGTMTGIPLRTLQGFPVTLTAVGEDGVVFTTRAGRVMPPVPLDEIDRAIDHLQRGFDISQPWRLRVFAGVSLESYVWALLHSDVFLARLRSKHTARAGLPAIALSADGASYVVRSRFGAADPRPSTAGATWDDELGAWKLARTHDNLLAARSAMRDELPGASGTSRPYMVPTRRGWMLFSPYADRELAKNLRGARWMPDERCWQLPSGPYTVTETRAAFGARVLVPPDAEESPAGSTPVVEPAPLVEPLPSADEVPELAPAPVGAPAAVPSDRALSWLATGLWDAPRPGEEESPGSRAGSLVAAGQFADALALTSGAPVNDPADAALLLAAHVSASVRATSPFQLLDVELETLATVPPVGHELLQAALRAALVPAGRANVLLCASIVAAGDDARLVQGQLASLEPGAERGRATFVAAALDLRRGDDFRETLAPARVAELAAACTTREFADLATSAWANDDNRLLRDLVSHGLRAALARGDVTDLRREVTEVLEVAQSSGAPRLPGLANEIGELLEAGQLVPAGLATATEKGALLALALETAGRFDDAPALESAWLRLIRFQQERGRLTEVIETARAQAQRPALRVTAETIIAYALTELGEATAAVQGLLGAAGRLRVSAPDAAAAVLAEARALAAGLPALEGLLPQDQSGETEAARAWPEDLPLLVIGGHTAVQTRGLKLLGDAKIPADWLMTEQAAHGDVVRARILGAAGVVVLCTPHISHAIAYRARDACSAAGVPLLLFDRFGPASLPEFLRLWLDGRGAVYRPRGQ